MTYFDCFVAGSWMFVLGWYVGAIYVQNHNEKRESPRASEKLEKWSPRANEELEPCAECDAWRVPTAAIVLAD